MIILYRIYDGIEHHLLPNTYDTRKDAEKVIKIINDFVELERFQIVKEFYQNKVVNNEHIIRSSTSSH